MYVDKLIQGRKALGEYVAKRWPGERIYWRETIGHIGQATVELFYAKADTEEQYKEYYWMYMDAPSETPKAFYNISDRRHEIYEGIRAGKIA